jgi:hypothetical protein
MNALCPGGVVYRVELMVLEIESRLDSSSYYLILFAKAGPFIETKTKLPMFWLT